ncbi:hypothetical protein IQ07DRAFT_523767 [Pyrenochaeta sp. DS3sAY3a]|nr:hypothetical protein IQ07DRAFT_523767 [Pyrenochaeta sp. DS3sAY3a]
MSSSEDSKPKAKPTNSSSPPTDDKKGASSPIKTPPKPTLLTDESSDQTLLEELFPETSLPPKPRVKEERDQYPKLELPDYTPIVRREFVDAPKSMKEKIIESFQSKGEQTTVLQLSHCSTELTEADFRRLIPKGKHMESWRREGEYFKIIPGRDPLSLERMPFYYILFKDPESALAYQKNASRLHKLSALHQPSNIFSAIPPPKGFLEDGEDLNKATSSYNLLPTHHHLSLSTLMQPYNPALRALIERGGYQPIVPDVDSTGTRISKVLLYIEGYEPSPSDLFKIFRRDAYVHGMPLPLRNESSSSIHRLRDIINLKTSSKPISSVRPRSYDHDSPDDEHAASAPAPSGLSFDDPGIEALWQGADEDSSAKDVNQMIMNRVYNRWVLEFGDEDAAHRFVGMWHRKVLPDLGSDTGAWKDVEEVRFCNAEVLW